MKRRLKMNRFNDAVQSTRSIPLMPQTEMDSSSEVGAGNLQPSHALLDQVRARRSAVSNRTGNSERCAYANRPLGDERIGMAVPEMR